jgi:metal-responsive CopG/Arc/MetJ family transcriptional regulator
VKVTTIGDMPGRKRRVVRVLITLPEDTLQQVNELADKLAMPRSTLIRLALIKFLEKPEPPRSD